MAAPSPPPNAQDLSLVDGVVQLSFAVHEILGAVAAEHDLSITQVRMLGVLRDREPSMLDLARFLSLEKSSVTGLVDRAQQRGLVARTRGVHDGRAVHVRLTSKGTRAAAAFSGEVTARIDALLSGLGGRERTQLAAMTSRIAERHADEKGIDLSAGMR